MCSSDLTLRGEALHQTSLRLVVFADALPAFRPALRQLDLDAHAIRQHTLHLPACGYGLREAFWLKRNFDGLAHGGRKVAQHLRATLAQVNQLPAGLSAASRSLDVLVLNDTILEPLLGLDTAARAAGEHIAFSEVVREAQHGVHSGEFRLAFLVQPVRVSEIVAIADAGELLPQKSTFFYPKLATGMVLNPLD